MDKDRILQALETLDTDKLVAEYKKMLVKCCKEVRPMLDVIIRKAESGELDAAIESVVVKSIVRQLLEE